MKKKIVSKVVLTMLLIGMLTFAFNIPQAKSPPPTEWTRTYGGANRDVAMSVVETRDEGYALAGYTESFGAGAADFWLVKVDSSGNMQWNKTCGGTGGDMAWSVVQTSDLGYAIAGDTSSFGAGAADLWLVKVGGPAVPEFPLGLGLMMALALVIPIVYLWRTRKMLGQH